MAALEMLREMKKVIGAHRGRCTEAKISCNLAAANPHGTPYDEIKAGVALGAWETLATSNPRGGLSTSRSEGAIDWNISFGETVETKNNELAVHVAHTKRSDWQTRVIAMSTAGAEITSSRWWTANEQTAIRFEKLSLDDVKELRFQVRPYEWVEFRNVALQRPRRPTPRRNLE